jgi:PAS domain S-box-containing protein
VDDVQPEWLQQIEGLLGTLNEGVMIVDDCSTIVYVNENLQEMLSRPSSELVGQTPMSFYSPEESIWLDRQRDQGIRDGHNRFEYTLPRKDGTRMPVIVSSRRIEDPDGRQFGIVTFIDITEQKQTEEKLRAANVLLEERQREIEEDLTLAARVQQSLAPKSMVWGSLRVDAFFHPVRSIGGDFGLVSPLDERHLNLFVCDVSGHGIGSALVANRIYSETMNQFRTGAPLGQVLQNLNSFVMRNIGSSVFFFTVAAARVDRDGRRMIFAGAGHPPAMIARAGQEPVLLESRSMVLGALPEAVGVEATLEVDLEHGDRVVLYTDGITDVFNSQGDMLGVEGVQKFVREASLLPFGQMKQGILDRVADFREGPPSDDVSLVLVEIS